MKIQGCDLREFCDQYKIYLKDENHYKKYLDKCNNSSIRKIKKGFCKIRDINLEAFLQIHNKLTKNMIKELKSS